MNDIKNVFKICFVIIGTIIGAGFASGQEIYSFFSIYGLFGVLGIIISSVIIGLVIFLTFNIILSNNIASYFDFANYLIKSNKVISYSINNIMSLFLLISFIVMVSGFGAFFKQEFNINCIFGSLLICVLSLVIFFRNIDGIIRINSFLIPILILLIMLLGFKNNIFYNNKIIFHTSYGYNWLIKSFLYASYNSITLIPIIINIKPLIKKASQIKYISFFSALIIIILSLTINTVLTKYIGEIKNLDIPLIYIAGKFGTYYKYLYSITILIAIFTTAVSSGFSLINNVSKTKKQYILFSICICVIAILCSNFGFTLLLNLLYPVIGFIGFLGILLIILKKITT